MILFQFRAREDVLRCSKRCILYNITCVDIYINQEEQNTFCKNKRQNKDILMYISCAPFFPHPTLLACIDFPPCANCQRKKERRTGRPSTGWRRLIGSPELQIIFHKRASKHRQLLRKIKIRHPMSTRPDVEMRETCVMM